MIEVDVVGEYCSRTHLSELMTRHMVPKPKAAESRDGGSESKGEGKINEGDGRGACDSGDRGRPFVTL